MTVVTVLHVLAAILFVGPSIVLSSASARVLRGGTEQLAAARFLQRSTLIYSAGTLLVLLLGLALVPLADRSYGDAWLSVSMALSFVAVLLLLGVVVPSQRSAVGRLEAGEPADEVASRVAALSGVAALLWVAVLVLMYWQPGS